MQKRVHLHMHFRIEGWKTAKLVHCTECILFWETCGFARNYRFVGDLHLGWGWGGHTHAAPQTPACDIGEGEGILIRERQISYRPGLIRLTLILPVRISFQRHAVASAVAAALRGGSDGAVRTQVLVCGCVPSSTQLVHLLFFEVTIGGPTLL